MIGLVAIFGEYALRNFVPRAYVGTVLVDFPDTASFLTPEEREYVIQKKSKLFYRKAPLRPF